MIQHKGFTTDGAQIDMRNVRVKLGGEASDVHGNPQGTRVNEVIDALERTVDEMIEAHNRFIDEVTQVISGNTEQILVDPNLIDVRPVAERTPPLAIRLDTLHSKMQRLLLAQIEARQAVRL